MRRRDHDPGETHHPHHHGGGGLGGFLRSLLSGLPWSDRAEAEESFTLAPPGSGKIKIENANGKTAVVGEDRNDVAVRVVKTARAESEDAARKLLERIRVEVSDAGDHLGLEVDVPKRWNRHGSANLEVRVPRGMRVGVFSSNGAVAIEGLRGDVVGRSSNGSICVEDVHGDVDVQTSNGKVCCSCTCGRLTARSSNRKIEIGEHEGSVDAMTSNGLIHASVESLGSEGLILSTSNGRIVVELPEKVDADVDLRVDNGVIRNHRELEGASGERTGRLRGRLGRGGVPIRLRTSNGSISLR
ncbi:MAG TPA: DUF4097 family beta strand repeat-containing protein [Myxococcota bacterium]|nr:DUF4097 family beta strand repeat-containing protein [Myxococcota bacterium]